MDYLDFLWIVPICFIILFAGAFISDNSNRLDKVEAILENRICNECNQILGD